MSRASWIPAAVSGRGLRGTRARAVAPFLPALCVATAAALVAGCGSGGPARQSVAAPVSLAPSPPGQPPPQITADRVSAALSALDGVVGDTMRRTAIPGVSVAVVHQDRVIYLKGFGVRRVGRPDTVDVDTVFQIASMSKPVATTVLARLVGDKALAWDDPVAEYDPGFRSRGSRG